MKSKRKIENNLMICRILYIIFFPLLFNSLAYLFENLRYAPPLRNEGLTLIAIYYYNDSFKFNKTLWNTSLNLPDINLELLIFTYDRTMADSNFKYNFRHLQISEFNEKYVEWKYENKYIRNKYLYVWRHLLRTFIMNQKSSR